MPHTEQMGASGLLATGQATVRGVLLEATGPMRSHRTKVLKRKQDEEATVVAVEAVVRQDKPVSMVQVVTRMIAARAAQVVLVLQAVKAATASS